MAGRYGPYVKWEKVNATLPKDLAPEAVTLDQALELIAAKAGKTGGRRTAGAKKAAPKATAKAAAAKTSTSKAATAKKAPARAARAKAAKAG